MSETKPCAKCGVAVEWSADVERLFGDIPRLCPACSLGEAEIQEVAVNEAARDRARAESRTCVNFARYREPLADLVPLNPAAWEFARTFDYRAGNVYIEGPEGTGKTALARYMLHRALDCGARRVYEISACEFDLGYGADILSEKNIQYISAASVLLIDDISAAPWNMRTLNILRLILDYRHDATASTILTSNLSSTELAEHMGKQEASYVISLLRRMNPVEKLTLTGESFRKTLKYGAWLQGEAKP